MFHYSIEVNNISEFKTYFRSSHFTVKVQSAVNFLQGNLAG